MLWHLLLLIATGSPALDDIGGSGTCAWGEKCATGVSGDSLVELLAAVGDMPLEAAVLADDGVRLRLARSLPKKAQSAQIRSASQIASVALGRLPGAHAEGHQHALVLLTFDGRTQWFRSRGGAHVPLESMGQVQEDKSKTTAIGMGQGDGLGVLALGHQGGNASIWQFLDGDHQPKWQRIAMFQASHHNWERVDHVAVSSDGHLLLACTEDNVMLWQVPNFQMHQESHQAQELRHLHGGASQVSAADVSKLSGDSYLVVVAFKSGTFEGWGVHASAGKIRNDVSDLWQMKRKGLARIVAVAVSPIFTARGDGCIIAAAGADGNVWLWQLGPTGAFVSGDSSPLWEVRPSEQGLPASSLALLAAPSSPTGNFRWWLAAGFGGQVVVFDGATGVELHRAVHTGSVLALSWPQK